MKDGGALAAIASYFAIIHVGAEIRFAGRYAREENGGFRSGISPVKQGLNGGLGYDCGDVFGDGLVPAQGLFCGLVVSVVLGRDGGEKKGEDVIDQVKHGVTIAGALRLQTTQEHLPAAMAPQLRWELVEVGTKPRPRVGSHVAVDLQAASLLVGSYG